MMMRSVEVLMVFGYRLEADDQPHRIMRDRVHAAFTILEDAGYKAGWSSASPAYDTLLLTGGMARPGQAMSEAEVMQLMLMGLQADRLVDTVILEQDSMNTLENIVNSVALLRRFYGDDARFNIEAVTHDWHSPRVRYHWKRARSLSPARQVVDQLAVLRPLKTKTLGRVGRIKQAMGNVATFFDPDRRILNQFRPSSA